MSILTNENIHRYTIFPIKYEDIWEMFNLHRKAFWVESEVDLSNDLVDWRKLNKDEQHFIKYVLAFFAGSDGIVLENLALRFFKDVQIPEARAFYSFQMTMETIHGIMYSQLIDAYIDNASEKKLLFEAIETIPCIQEKAKWAQKYIESDANFATRLVAFACVEGIFFSGAFCSIFWLQERGVLPGLCMSNRFISTDEGLHCDFAVLLYTKYVDEKLPFETVKAIITEAVEIEESFIIEALPCSILGMNSNSMREYIRFVANRLSLQLGYPKIYEGARQPFSFIARNELESKTSFFEGRVSSYQMTVGEQKEGDNLDSLDFNADF